MTIQNGILKLRAWGIWKSELGQKQNNGKEVPRQAELLKYKAMLRYF